MASKIAAEVSPRNGNTPVAASYSTVPNENKSVQPAGPGLVGFAERRARDVAAVELADRHEVDHRDEQADPAGERHGVQLNVEAIRRQPAAEHRFRVNLPTLTRG